jgi:hypothetical protein
MMNDVLASKVDIMTSKKFCLITPGRAGSTALMKVVEGFEDIKVPNKNIDCPNNELIQQRKVKLYKHLYSELTKTNINSNRELIDEFYMYNRDFPYVGFKTMPMRHKDDQDFLLREDIKFIILTREDIPSTVASFIAARRRNSWDRKGGANQTKFVIRGIEKLMVWGNISYISKSIKALSNIKNAINIKYEDLCSPGFNNLELNAFFGRSIKLENPNSPTSGKEYIENWEWLERSVERWFNKG